MLCDGRMVCGCADPYGKRVLGDARSATVSAIWTGERAVDAAPRPERRRIEVLRRLPAEAAAEEGRARRRSGRSTSAPLPSRLYIECTAACNISCAQACCAPETGITRTRQAGMLDFDLFTRVVDEAGPSLGRIDFFNYGEAFLHKRAVEMCEYIKTQLPAHLSLHEHQRPGAHRRRRRAGWCTPGIDEVTFSIDGATPESYVKYRQRGDFDKAIAQPARDGRREAHAPAATCRSSTGATSCSRQRQRRGDGRARGRMAAEIGVDRLCWELTDHPEDMFSRRFVPGTPELAAIRHEIWDDNNLGNAIPGATPRARDRRARARCPGLPVVAPRRPPAHADARASATSRRARSRRRRVTAGGWCASARSCAAATARVINRDFARAWLPADAAARRHGATSPIDDHRARQAGPLRAEVRSGQRRDRLVRGCGSPTTIENAGGDLRRSPRSGSGSGSRARGFEM